MEEVAGIPGILPIFADYPPECIQTQILREEWQSCLDAWIFAIKFRLRLQVQHFRQFKLSQTASGLPFLLSYLRAFGEKLDNVPNRGHREANLHKHCFLLTRRLLSEASLPYDCSATDLFSLLSDGALAFHSGVPWMETLAMAWKRARAEILVAVEERKTALIQGTAAPAAWHEDVGLTMIKQATTLAKVWPEAGVILMTGSDYLDSLIASYAISQKEHKERASKLSQQLTSNVYFGLKSLANTDPPQSSLLFDHLYNLKSSADQSHKADPPISTLLSDLLCSTNFLQYLDSFLATHEHKRGASLLSKLHIYQTNYMHLHPTPVRPKKRGDKGKSRAMDIGEMHIHEATQVSQIQDLFPDLPLQYVLELLDHFSNDVENAITALLEPQLLPSDLRNPGSSLATVSSADAQFDSLTPAIAKAVGLERRNVFDGDEFDNLRISTSNVHMGKKELKIDQLPSSEGHALQKAAILAALTAIDFDDDERDDTYDFADVGGTVDDTIDADSRPHTTGAIATPGISHEERLLGAWADMPAVFARDTKTRLSQPRRQLKEETNMTDEQLEGWAITLERDQSLLARLERTYRVASKSGGSQQALAASRWRESEDDDSQNELSGQEGGSDSSGRRARGFIRGRGRRSPSGGKIKASISEEQKPAIKNATKRARQRKEQGRGRGGANHNRRDAHTRKVGRGMAGDAPA